MTATAYRYRPGDIAGPSTSAASGEVYAQTGTTALTAGEWLQVKVEDGVTKAAAIAGLKVVMQAIENDPNFVVA